MPLPTLQDLIESLQRTAQLRRERNGIQQQINFAARRGDVDETARLATQWYKLDEQLEIIRNR